MSLFDAEQLAPGPTITLAPGVVVPWRPPCGALRTRGIQVGDTPLVTSQLRRMLTDDVHLYGDRVAWELHHEPARLADMCRRRRR